MEDDFDIIDRLMRQFFGNDDFEGGYKYSKPKKNYSENGIDIFEFKDKLSITAELKAAEEDMKITPEEDGLIIELMNGGTWRRRKIHIPRIVNPDTAKISYINGILDVELEYLEEENDKDIR